VEKRRFTTAHLAAEIIGKHRLEEGVEVLRQSLRSRDIFLIGKSMVSLARLDDRETIAEIERIFSTTRNPRLVIHGATALEIFGSPTSIPTIVKKLEQRTTIFVRDEIILALAGILGIQDFFYPLYLSFINNMVEGTARLGDTIDELMAKRRQPEVEEKQLRSIVRAMTKDERRSTQRQTQELHHVFGTLKIRIADTEISHLLQEAAQNAKVVGVKRFRFLMVAAAIWFSFYGDDRPSRPGSSRSRGK
jgi:hypothetical protein